MTSGEHCDFPKAWPRPNPAQTDNNIAFQDVSLFRPRLKLLEYKIIDW